MEKRNSGFLSLLRNKEFLKLWAAQVLAYISDRITQMALFGWLIASTGKSGVEMAKITFFSLLPSFLFGQIAGAYADRFSRKILIALSVGFRALVVFVLSYIVVSRTADIRLVYFLIFLIGTGTSFAYPARLSLIPSLVPADQLQAANALSSITGMGTTFLGTYLASFLIQRAGFSSGFIFNGVSYLLAGFIVFSICYNQPVSATQGKENFIQNLISGAQYLKNHRRAFNLIFLSVTLSFLSSFFYISLTVLAIDHFKIGTQGIGKLLTMLGTGMFAGAYLSVVLKKLIKPTHLLIVSFLVIFFTNLTAAAVNSYARAWIWLMLTGMSASVLTITIDTLLQQISPNRLRGKVFGLRSTLQNGVFLLSLLGVAELLKTTSPFTVLKFLAAISFGISAIILILEKNFFYLIIRALTKFILKVFFSFEVEGREYLRYRSKVILAGNHTGFLDSALLIAASERGIKFLVAQSVFSWPIIGWFVKRAGVIPVIKGKGNEAITQAIECLQSGRAIGIFPEGKLSTNGKIDTFHKGVARLHKQSQAPIVPFVIHGGYEAWHWGQVLPKPRKVILQFGQPIEKFDGAEETLVEEIRQRVQFMKEALERRELSISEQVYLESVLSLMQMKSDVYGARTALSLKEDTRWAELSYIELSRQSKDLSNYLMEKGIKRGDRIAILSEARPEWGISFFASIRSGAITVPLDIKLTATELVSILANAEPRVLFVSAEFLETGKALKTLIPSLEQIILLNAKTIKGEQYFRNLKASTDFPGRERDIDEVALIIYTSGTTGSPKGVMTTFRNLIFEVKNFEEIMNLTSEDMFLSILPLNHLLELTGGFLGVLHAGGRICYSQSLHPQEISKIMREKHVTYMVTVPLFLKMLKSSIEKEIKKAKGLKQTIFKLSFNVAQATPHSFKKLLFYPIHQQFGGKLRGFIAGGAPLDIEVGEFFDRLGIPVYQGYGLTETSPVITVNTPMHNRLGSVGRPLKGVYARIEKGENDQEGEIITKGPHVMKGYYKRDDLTNEVIDEGRWFHTGDLGKIDKDGFLYITGRIKNLIVLGGGKKVHPEEVEACLSRSPMFKEVCILGRKSTEGKKEGTEEAVAVIVPSDSIRNKYPEHQTMEKELEKEVARLSQDLAQYKRPTKTFIHLEELPKTATRKIKRPLVREWLHACEAKEGKV